MRVYDLDKTQVWLNKTIQLNAHPPVRGGIVGRNRYLHIFVGFVSVVGMALLLIILWPRSKPVQLAMVGSITPDRARVQDVTPVLTTSVAHEDNVVQKSMLIRGNEHRGVGITRGDGFVPPSAPIFLDGLNSTPRGIVSPKILKRIKN
ncbi:MAG: hypothetical protein ABJA67_02245 [Chthonomonadales bacterium]